MLVIGVRVTPSPADICRGHDPVKAITDCISCFIVRRNKHPSSVGMLYSDRAEPPKCSSDKSSSSSGEIEGKRAAFGCWICGHDPCPVLAWRALRVQPKVSNPLCSSIRGWGEITQWSRWAKQPKAIDLRVLLSVSISISHVHTARYLGKASCAIFYNAKCKDRGEEEETEENGGESTFLGRPLWFLHLLQQTWPQSHPWEHGKKKNKKKHNSQSNIKVNHTHWRKRACELWHRAADVTQMVFMPTVPCLYMS